MQNLNGITPATSELKSLSAVVAPTRRACCTRQTKRMNIDFRNLTAPMRRWGENNANCRLDLPPEELPPRIAARLCAHLKCKHANLRHFARIAVRISAMLQSKDRCPTPCFFRTSCAPPSQTLPATALISIATIMSLSYCGQVAAFNACVNYLINPKHLC